MPKCAVCGDTFYHDTWSAPAEPCDCGNCYDASYVESEEDRHEVLRLAAEWRERCADPAY